MRYISIVLLVLSSLSVHAQLIKTSLKPRDERQNWHGNIGFALNLQKHTNDIFAFDNVIGVQFNKGRHYTEVSNEINLFRTKNDTALINKGNQYFRYFYALKDTGKISMEFLIQNEYDQARLMKTNFGVSLGPQFQLLKGDYSYFYLGTLLMYDYEQVDTAAMPDNDPHPPILGYEKANVYIATGYIFDETMAIYHTTYFQPAFRNFADFRVRSQTSLNFKVAKKILFGVTLDLIYDAQTPIPVPNLTYELKNSLSFVF